MVRRWAANSRSLPCSVPQAEPVRNTVWLTADVHYTAAHYYDPAKAQFTGFDPFWEFVSGPLNAGTFGPGVENTFGPYWFFKRRRTKASRTCRQARAFSFSGK